MLNEIFSPSRIKLDLKSTTKHDVFGELVNTIALPGTELNHMTLLEAVNQRESKMNTMILPGVALPHGYCSAVSGIVGAVGFSRAGVEYDSLNRDPVHLFFMLLMDESSREQHLHVLSQILELLNSAAFAGIREAETPREIYDLVCQY